MYTRSSDFRSWCRFGGWLALALAASGCPNQELAPLEPCTVSEVSADIPVGGVDKVDLLFVIDNSISMREEQSKLAEQLPELVRILTTGKYDRDSAEPDFPPVRDLHLGVISSDMGASGTPGISRCDKGNGFGDDGVLISAGRDTACQGFRLSGPPYLTFSPDGGRSAEQVAADFKCLAALGTDGCGFEQQLEAMYKALAPSSVTFARGTGGHGDGKNAGFLRSEAVLAVIQVTDEEDCSVTDQGVSLVLPNQRFPLPDGSGNIGSNLRCAYKADDSDLIHPAQRYIDGLLALKPLNPDRIIFAAIAGIPLEAEGKAPTEILAHPQMRFEPDGDPKLDGTQAKPACVQYADGEELSTDREEVTRAAPAVRLVKVAQGFGDNGIVRSICAESYAPALDGVIQKISKQLKGACLKRPLRRNADGIVECAVVEILGRGVGPKGCDASRGRVYMTDREVAPGDKRTVCKVNQVAVDARNDFKPSPQALPDVPPHIGWYYDDFTDAALDDCADTPHRISFNPASAQPVDSTIRFECSQPVARNDVRAHGRAAVNSACEREEDCTARNDSSELIEAGLGYALTCQASTQTCQISCAEQVHCPLGWACHGESGLCANPTCPPSALR